MKNIAKTYDPKSFEDRIYQSWEEDGDFIADAKSKKPPYSIVMPPPNVTGQLHMGHAMNNTLQDILTRWKRMSGYEVLWLPGTDHASISTEAKVVEMLAEQGISKKDLGREKFLEKSWEWTRKYGGTIRKQLKKLGVSCDWSRERFTLDQGLSQAVYRVFKTLYEEGKIYRGDRIVNWCPSCKTAISDAEVDHEDENGHLWYIRYPYKDHEGYVTIATTRPETMLGDLAVAVHPEDERYKDKLGEKLVLPLVGREIPLIADDYVDPEYGTGCVKITPSHDPNDFEVGERHNLGQCLVIENDGRISAGYDPYSGLDRCKARKCIVEDLKEAGYLDHIEDLVHAVGHCSRCDTVIEPILSKQWFVAMEDYIRDAKNVVEDGELKMVPSRFDKIYKNWVDNIHDWTISRQLWWGHRIPVWYCDDCGEITVSETEVSECSACHSKNIRQDPDTLDTWFSSALWPFSTMGWPEETDDLKKFFPTDTLVTGYDIIFFWVIRMVFSSLHFMGQLPFKTVYFNGLVRDAEGRKMSKSLGNGVDPLEIIDKYGADALRYTLVTGNTPGNDTRFSEKKVEASRNFANKLWNACRFLFMNMEEEGEIEIDMGALRIEDKWISSSYNSLVKNINQMLDRLDIGMAAHELYNFTWFSFCDWYIELVKNRLNSGDKEEKNEALAVLQFVIKGILKLLHPFMPFITEEIWQSMPNACGKIIHAPYPVWDEKLDFNHEEKSLDTMLSAITAIRNERQSRGIAASKKSRLIIYSESDEVRKNLKGLEDRIMSLASASQIEITNKDPDLEGAAVIVLENMKIYLPLAGLIDYDRELEKLTKEEDRIKNEIGRLEKKLSNPGFVNNAPKEVVDKENEKLDGYKAILPEVSKSLEELRKEMRENNN